MNTNKTVLSIVEKLKPAKKAVELSVVSDLENLFESLDESYNEAIYYSEGRLDDLADEFINVTSPIKTEIDEMAINGSARFLEEESEKVQELIQELNEKTSELGIDPRELVQNYDQLNEMSLSGKMVYDELVSKYREVIKYTGNNDFL
jgi:CII-binding regulator of phage lambda lysogenization HflD